MSAESIRLLKQCARAELRGQLAAMDTTARCAASASIAEQIAATGAWKRATCALLYRAFADEPDLQSLAADALARGVMLAMPRVEADGRMLFRQVNSLQTDAWEVDACGVRSPRGVEVDAAKFDFIAVPGVGFATDGARLGRGKGYYDRMLETLAPEVITVGIAFACQIRNRLPLEPHDARVQWIATEDGVFKSATQ
ncbi:MAG: 5-formyltetrahydrofolate cyclo-ligase [Phycisphaerales bacterium]|nr:5-formyltetrahydrofolate cyclo-ligase [Phycisphaerales bacterium]